ncbi:MAG: DegT/DnrJ/EryC1/StrS family aminotransferase [Trueperaceae bacterium]|nr:MAG: DegT/DnrJ/EryC1/StrS family aminotransferase [Trueperaceae bacterium]
MKPPATRQVTKRLTVIDDEIRHKVLEVLERTPYYAGPETEAFEREVAAYCEANHGIAANSGTSCLLLALMALEIGKGDEVILPSHTFVSVIECVLAVGAAPVLTDVEEDGNLSCSIVERHLSKHTRAVIPVHMYGHPVDLDPILNLAKEREFFVIEDAAHALGSRYRGKRVGGLGHIGFFSFAGKSITVCGQAGMAVTNDEELAERMTALRVHGWRQRVGNVWHVSERLGLNLRTSELLSAIGRINLTRLDGWTEVRAGNAAKLTELLTNRSLPLTTPRTRDDQEPGWLHYVVRAPRRDELEAYLAEQGIETAVHYRVPLHRQPAFQKLAPDPEAFPITEQLSREILTLPSHPWLSDDDLGYMADSIEAFFRA